MSQYRDRGCYRQSNNGEELKWLEDGIHILFSVTVGSVATLLRCLCWIFFGSR